MSTSLSTQKLNDFPFIIVSCFISFMMVTAGAAIVPMIAFPGAYVACIGGTVSSNSWTEQPYSAVTVVNNVLSCQQGQVTTNVTLQSVAISFFIYSIGFSLLWWAVRFIKLKTRK